MWNVKYVSVILFSKKVSALFWHYLLIDNEQGVLSVAGSESESAIYNSNAASTAQINRY